MKNVYNLYKIIFIIYLLINPTLLSRPDFSQSSSISLKESKEGIWTGIETNGPLNSLTSNKFQFREKEEMKRLSEIENYNPKQRRKTQDGKFCAKAFVSDRQTYFDCTMTRTPDGDITDIEWCYIDSSYTDKRKWGYCEPILDYDRVRAANFGVIKELNKLISSLNLEVGQNLSPAQISMEDLKKVKGLQITIAERINKLNKTVDKIYNNLQKLEKVREACNDQDRKVKDLVFQIDGKRRETKARQQLEEQNFALAIKTPYCKGMLLYEHEEAGDGLIGHYHDNENWLGEHKTLKSKEINFDWTDGEPIKGINPNNFSVIWKGWLKIEISDTYQFSIECDDGAELYINDELIISRQTGSLVKSYKASLMKQNTTSTDEVDPNKKTNPSKSMSNEMYLIGGIKLTITLKYFHSIHTSVFSEGQVFLRLLWQSKDFREMIIPAKYLFSAYNFNQLKITEYNVEDAQLRRLHENDIAFMNSDRYIIQDVPSEFINSPVLKLQTRYMKDYLDLETNGPTNAYVGLLAHYPNPLSASYENTGMSMSLLQLEKNQSKGSKRLMAKKSVRLIIYKRSYNIGKIQIKLTKFGINSKGVPMILFFGFDSSAKSPSMCTGKEEIISESTGKYFKSCLASSDIFGYKCEDGFSGKMRDEEGGMWAANSDGVGAWISIHFKGVFKFTKIQYRNRKNPIERNSSIEIQFSTGESQIIHFKNEDEISTHKFDSVRANSIKFVIKGVYGVNNNGGAFSISGVKCHQDSENDDDEEENITNTSQSLTTNESPTGSSKIEPPINPSLVQSLFIKDKNKPIFLSCFDSLSNSSKFDTIKLKTNKKIIVKCPESCAMSEIPIYGTSLYTRDSAICKAAFHAQKITSTGGLVTIILKPGSSNYKGSLSNSVKSKGKIRSLQSLAFEMYEEEDVILLKPGTKVDLKMENSFSSNSKEMKWVGAIITKVLDTNNGKFASLILDGENSNSMDLPYPNIRIHPCGENVQNRDCKGSLKRLKKKLPVLIRFVPINYQSNITDRGYLSDNGQLFGKFGKSFGWSANMSTKILIRTNTNHPYLETFIVFPPPPTSKYCSRSRPEQLCEPVTWRVKAGKGKFLLKLYIGDANVDRIIDLKINNKSLATNKLIPRNTLEVIEDILETKDKMFELSSYCSGDCDNSISIINAIEISPNDKDSDELDSVNKQKMTPCGHSFTGGRCNKGPDVSHCLFDDPTVPSAKFCNGSYALISIPQNYKCKEQYGQYKCVSKLYVDSKECRLSCPNECQDSKCVY